MLLASIVHTCDPFIVRFTDSFGIRWYGLSYAIGMLAGWAILRWLSRTGRTPLDRAQIDSFTTWIILGLLVGGRLGHVIFYEPELITHISSKFPFWGVLEIHRGGMSSHGGIIGVGLALVMFSRGTQLPLKHPFLHLGDLVTLVATIGLGLGRLANWINGELPGRKLSEAMQGANAPWWSVKYPSELLEPSFWNHLDPDQARRLSELAGAIAGADVAKVSVPGALHDACYAHNHVVIDAVAPLLTARYPTNFMQAFTDGVILLSALAIVWLRPRRPGTVMGTFFIGYGVLRVMSEQFRVADPDSLGPIFAKLHLEAPTWLTLPVLLSLVMVLIGIAILVIVRIFNDPPIGGLLPSTTAKASR